MRKWFLLLRNAVCINFLLCPSGNINKYGEVTWWHCLILKDNMKGLSKQCFYIGSVINCSFFNIFFHYLLKLVKWMKHYQGWFWLVHLLIFQLIEIENRKNHDNIKSRNDNKKMGNKIKFVTINIKNIFYN